MTKYVRSHVIYIKLILPLSTLMSSFIRYIYKYIQTLTIMFIDVEDIKNWKRNLIKHGKTLYIANIKHLLSDNEIIGVSLT